MLGSPPDTRWVKKPLNRPEAMQGPCVDNHGSLRRRFLSPAALGEACCSPQDTAASSLICGGRAQAVVLRTSAQPPECVAGAAGDSRAVSRQRAQQSRTWADVKPPPSAPSHGKSDRLCWRVGPTAMCQTPGRRRGAARLPPLARTRTDTGCRSRRPLRELRPQGPPWPPFPGSPMRLYRSACRGQEGPGPCWGRAARSLNTRRKED